MVAPAAPGAAGSCDAYGSHAASSAAGSCRGRLVVAGRELRSWLAAVIALGAAAAWLRQPKLLLGGPIIYGLSWLVFAIGLAFIGSKSVSAGRAMGLLLVRRLAEKFLQD